VRQPASRQVRESPYDKRFEKLQPIKLMMMIFEKKKVDE